MMVTGRLENWYWATNANVIWGNLYDDIHKRWNPGTLIHTSLVQFPTNGLCGEGDVIRTLNSHYLLGKEKVYFNEPE